jgi:DNA polymerase elongation subunit (family B)
MFAYLPTANLNPLIMQNLNQQLKNTLFIDIETVSGHASFAGMDNRMQKLWEKKSSSFKSDADKTPQDFFPEKAAIFAEFGKVICIGMGAFYENKEGELCFKVKSLGGDNEKALLNDFKNIIEDHKSKKDLILCAHNGKEFDFPYLCRRMLVNSITLPHILKISGKKPWEINHVDTMELWKFGDYKHYTSLDLLSAIFDIPSSKSEIDGSDVNRVYYEEKNLDKIQKYCRADVVVLAQLFLKLNGSDIIPPERIFYS